MEPAAWAVPARPGGPITTWRHAGCHQARRRAPSVRPTSSPVAPAQQVEVVVPVHNVAATLERDIRALRRSLDESFPFLAVVTIADTGSSDGTAPIAQDLAATLPGVQALLLDRDDLGHVLRMALASSRTEIVACADGPSSASLPRLVSLVESVLTGPVDLAVATHAHGEHGDGAARPAHRWPARFRRHLRRVWPGAGRREHDCGLTAVRRARALEILPLIDDRTGSFATGLVRAAGRRGLRITEIPVS